jgi:hypothetical protein
MIALDMPSEIVGAATKAGAGSVGRKELVCAARKLHLQMFRKRLSLRTKISLSRKVSGLLFAAEAEGMPATESRGLIHQLRSDAHFQCCEDMATRDALAVAGDYDRLTSMI